MHVHSQDLNLFLYFRIWSSKLSIGLVDKIQLKKNLLSLHCINQFKFQNPAFWLVGHSKLDWFLHTDTMRKADFQSLLNTKYRQSFYFFSELIHFWKYLKMHLMTMQIGERLLILKRNSTTPLVHQVLLMRTEKMKIILMLNQSEVWLLGGFQLLDLIITELNSHMTC